MSDWSERAYAGGPMVKVAGFPRPLYPPDAAEHGKQPSSDGPDVIAYKRTVSRAGRHPWQAFDDAYSNSFAHGSDPQVAIYSGVAGVQRVQELDATGWIGSATFNTLRSIRVPDDLPHAGEMAMDATAVGLIEEAWSMFGGHEPDHPNGALRQGAIAKAKAEIGYVEEGGNRNKYGAWYGMDGQPWCAMFVTWCFEHAGDSPAFVKGSRYAYVPYVVGDARAGRNGLATVDEPIAGDLVCYDWNWNGEHDHIGLFERWEGGSFYAIEGNTSPANASNGGQVMRVQRWPSSQGTVFVRVEEP